MFGFGLKRGLLRRIAGQVRLRVRFLPHLRGVFEKFFGGGDQVRFHPLFADLLVAQLARDEIFGNDDDGDDGVEIIG